MAVILTESVAITKSRLTKGFNGDNLNLNGRTLTAEDADKGFKAAGAVKPPYVAVIASGHQKGFAAGAASAFNDYAKDIHINKYNAQGIINKFFDDMEAVTEKCGLEDSKLSLGIVCAYSDCVVAAKTGSCHLLRFSDGELFEIALSETEDGRGFQFIDVIADGDIFALIGEECSRDLDYDKIVTAFDANTDLKLMIRDMFNIVAANARGMDCSVILMRLKSDCERTFASIPSEAAAADESDIDQVLFNSDPENFDVQPPISENELDENNEVVSDDEIPENGKSPSAKKKIANIIPIVILIIILAVAAALYLATKQPIKPVDNGESNSSKEPATILNEYDTNGDFNGSNGMQTVDDTEHGGNAADLNNGGSTTTRRADTETTTRRQQQPVTQAPTTQEPTTQAPEPGNEEPGNEEPGNEEPGNEEPGNEEPGNEEPGNEEPGNEEPGNEN